MKGMFPRYCNYSGKEKEGRKEIELLLSQLGCLRGMSQHEVTAAGVFSDLKRD